MALLELANVEVVVLCGGRGTRLGRLTAQTPKPLLPIQGEPFLLRRLRDLQQEGCQRFILAAHYLAEQFVEFTRTYAAQLPRLRVITEPAPLGTGGALRFAAQCVESEVFVALNGDTWVPQPIRPVYECHALRASEMTMVAVRSARVQGGAAEKDHLLIGPQDHIRGFVRTPPVGAEGWVNAGLYVLRRDVVHRWPLEPFTLEERLLELTTPGRVHVFYSEEVLLDIGTPACYAHAEDA